MATWIRNFSCGGLGYLLVLLAHSYVDTQPGRVMALFNLVGLGVCFGFLYASAIVLFDAALAWLLRLWQEHHRC